MITSARVPAAFQLSSRFPKGSHCMVSGVRDSSQNVELGISAWTCRATDSVAAEATVSIRAEGSHFDLWEDRSIKCGIWLPVHLNISDATHPSNFAADSMQLSVNCRSVAAVDSFSYPYKRCASGSHKYAVEFKGTLADSAGPMVLEILATKWRHVEEGSWVMNMWIPFPRNLFAKRDTRTFDVNTSIKFRNQTAFSATRIIQLPPEK
ncbi:hypothetical protein B0H13DRAFT_1987450 [Mycena leptocephala]|nr:hypothetical protein B0H13DRAFT_1987450 [Mycena leptocephala]